MENFLAEVRLNEDRLRMSYEDEIGAVSRNLRTETKKKNYLLKKIRNNENSDVSRGESMKDKKSIANKRQKKNGNNIMSAITSNENNNININDKTKQKNDLNDTTDIVLCTTVVIERGPPIQNNHSSSNKIKSNKQQTERTRHDITSPNTVSTRETKFIETVRGKDARDALPGFACIECESFYAAMVQQGMIEAHELTEHLRECSRHKARWKPPSTPDGFWDLTVRTPEDWT